MSEDSHAEVQTNLPRFQFVRVLGRGVLGEAHEVIDEVRSESVVLKIFRRCRPRNADQFKLEFESLARLEHESLVRMHHLVDPASETNLEIETRLGAGLAFTQEFVEGVDLLTWVNRPASDADLTTLETRRTPTTGEVPLRDNSDSDIEQVTASGELDTEDLSADIAVSIVEELANSSEARGKPSLDLILLRLEKIVPQIVSGLKYLHRFHKVHGFLRPSNILVTRTGACKLTDYAIVGGLVYASKDASDEDVSLLCAPEQLPYVAPEIVNEATPAGDLYSLGTVLFEAVAGYPPADVMEFVGGRNRRLEVPPLAELVPECPAVWAECIDALLRPDPQERPALSAIVEVMGEGRAVRLPPSVVPEPEGFVGQAKLLAELRAQAHDVSEQATMRLVMLEGQSGVGKTVLIEEFAHWLSRRGWLVISGQCFNRESVPMQGWHEIAHRLEGVMEGLPASLQDAIAPDRRLAGVLFPELALDHVTPEKPVGRLASIRALRRLLGFVSEQRPILICIEDLHWASWDTASLLMDLFSETARVRALLIGSWRTDSRRSDEHFLTRDLELSLVEVRRLKVTGFTMDAAREFLITQAPNAELDDLRKILRAGRANPRILRELVWELEKDQLDSLDLEKIRGEDLLKNLFTARMVEFDKAHEAMVRILAIASGPMEHNWLLRAVEAEIIGSVLPTEQTNESIEQAFAVVEDQRLVKRQEDGMHRARWVIADDVVREIVLNTLSERDCARLAGRIADTIGERRADKHDLRFEYELRAARVAKAIKAAVRAARAAEARFAYHRASKLWRWLLDHEDKLDDPTVNPGAELARAEHLAGQHAEAAELYHEWAEGTSDNLRRAAIRRDEAAAWLQAGNAQAAVDSLDAAFRDCGQTYMGRWHAPLSETPRRLVATWARWNERLVGVVQPGSAAKGETLLAELYDFALRYNPWLESARGAEIEARLALLAASSRDSMILALHRMRLATLHAGDGIVSRRDRAFAWLDEAEQILERVDEPAKLAQVYLVRAMLQLRYGDYDGAAKSLLSLMQSNEKAEEGQRTDRRWSLYHRAVLALHTARLDDANGRARQLLHTYRGDRLAASKAYEVLAEVALLRGEAEFAAAFLEAALDSVKIGPNASAVAQVYVLQAQIHIALGRPEVALGQLQVREELLAATPFVHDIAFEVPLQLGIGFAAAAVAERQRLLAEPRQDATRSLLRGVQKRLEPHLGELNNRRRAEVLRLFTRIALVHGKPRKALKYADLAVEALGSIAAPIDIGRCCEARGWALQRLERAEGRGIIEQAWELYRHYGVSFPLVLEGWPVPRDGAMLKDD